MTPQASGPQHSAYLGQDGAPAEARMRFRQTQRNAGEARTRGESHHSRIGRRLDAQRAPGSHDAAREIALGVVVGRAHEFRDRAHHPNGPAGRGLCEMRGNHGGRLNAFDG